MNERTYGTDETAEFDALAEAERLPDGTLRMTVVQIDKRDALCMDAGSDA